MVVASLPRSGTHLLIDAILNHFPEYKRPPLYVNLDRLLEDRQAVDMLLAYEGYVVKTHYPFFGSTAAHDDQVVRVAESGAIIMPFREHGDVRRSARSMRLVDADATFDMRARAFEKFWRPYPAHVVGFHDLTDPSCYRRLVADLGAAIGMTPRSRTVPPPAPDQRLRLYAAKTATRLLGRRSPVVNTTIRVGLTDRPEAGVADSHRHGRIDPGTPGPDQPTGEGS